MITTTAEYIRAVTDNDLEYFDRYLAHNGLSPSKNAHIRKMAEDTIKTMEKFYSLEFPVLGANERLSLNNNYHLLYTGYGDGLIQRYCDHPVRNDTTCKVQLDDNDNVITHKTMKITTFQTYVVKHDFMHAIDDKSIIQLKRNETLWVTRNYYLSSVNPTTVTRKVSSRNVFNLITATTPSIRKSGWFKSLFSETTYKDEVEIAGKRYVPSDYGTQTIDIDDSFITQHLVEIPLESGCEK